MKTDEQFAKDIAIGNAWEMDLWKQLSRYIYGIDQPVQPDRFGDKIIGGFTYRPDMKVRAMAVAQSGHDARFYAGVDLCIEAKVRLGAFRFTGVDDFPFEDIIVNEVYKTSPEHLSENEYLRMGLKEQKSYMRPFHSYWIGSSDKQHVAVICPATKPLWFQQTTYSPKDRRPALNWHCPIRKPDGKPAVFFGRFPESVGDLLTRL